MQRSQGSHTQQLIHNAQHPLAAEGRADALCASSGGSGECGRRWVLDIWLDQLFARRGEPAEAGGGRERGEEEETAHRGEREERREGESRERHFVIGLFIDERE